ncbi:MAG: hypothetical protein ACQET1_01585, partial [Gemmatimonadota bacterium]
VGAEFSGGAVDFVGAVFSGGTVHFGDAGFSGGDGVVPAVVHGVRDRNPCHQYQLEESHQNRHPGYLLALPNQAPHTE